MSARAGEPIDVVVPPLYRALGERPGRPSWHVPVLWLVCCAAAVAAYPLRTHPPNPLSWFLVDLASYCGVLASWIVWHFFLQHAAVVASGWTGFTTKADVFMRRALRVRWVCGLTVVFAALFVWFAMHNGAPWSPFVALTLVVMSVSAAHGFLMIGVSVVIYFRVGRSDPSTLAISRDDPLNSPVLRSLTDVARFEAVVGAVLFFFVLTPVTSVVRAHPSTFNWAAWWLALVTTTAGVLVVGLAAPRWIARPARTSRRDDIGALRGQVGDAWRRYQASGADGAARSRAALDLQAATAALDVLASTDETLTRWTDLVALTISGLPLLVQAASFIATR